MSRLAPQMRPWNIRHHQVQCAAELLDVCSIKPRRLSCLSISSMKLDDEDAEEVATAEARRGKPYVARAYKQGNASATWKQTSPILWRLMGRS
ncbi:hypothetical protein BDR05DRAFT_964143 [Suillus weaverae]|nr:hypothetical protein BDR05DRAFT_964143 [Suillus weaverae]